MSVPSLLHAGTSENSSDITHAGSSTFTFLLLLQSAESHCAYLSRIMKIVDVKTSVMKLLAHESAEVRKEALLSLQKLMVSNWEYLTQS